MKLDLAGRVLAVLEDQRESRGLPRNLLCAVSLADGVITELAGGHDFMSVPGRGSSATAVASPG